MNNQILLNYLNNNKFTQNLKLRQKELDKNNIQQLLHTFPDLKSADAYFLCGPGDLIDQINELLLLNQVAQYNIHFERFTTTKKEEETTKQIKDITAMFW